METGVIPTHLAISPSEQGGSQLVTALTEAGCPERSRWEKPQCLWMFRSNGSQVEHLAHIDPKERSLLTGADGILGLCLTPPLIEVGSWWGFHSKQSLQIGVSKTYFRYQPYPFPSIAYESDEVLSRGYEIPQKMECVPQKTRKVLILAEGLGSSLNNGLDTQSQAFSEIRRAIGPLYDDVITYSYLGGRMVEVNPDQLIWLPNSYLAENTFQSPDKSALNMALMIGQYQKAYPNSAFDGVGHSLGGFTLWQAVKRHLLPETGLLRNTGLRSIATIASPVNGSEQTRLTAWLQSAGLWDFQTQGGNEVVVYLDALAQTEEKRAQTIAINASVANFLTKEGGFRVFTIGSSDDCIVTDRDAIIPGFGMVIQAGRGLNGVSSCNPISAWELLLKDGGVATNAGHSQSLTHYQVLQILAELASS